MSSNLQPNSKTSNNSLPEKVQSALRLIHDSKGFWRVQVTPADEHMPPYEAVYSGFQVVGNGSFGVVCLAKDMKRNENVAIKIVFQDRRYKNRELAIMRTLNHQNVVQLKEFFYKIDDLAENDLYLNLVLEYVPDTIFNLSQKYLKHKRLIPPLHIKLYIYQLLRALAYIHSKGICHRDIKPQNLLLDPQSGVVKLCDFGSAKQLVFGESNVSYICSRYYRAPELLMGAADYTTAVDVWSAGCVLAEMMLGSPIFPGKTDVDQMVQIIKILGTPTKEQIYGMNPKYNEYKFPAIQACNISQIFPQPPAQLALEFLLKLLVYIPSHRLTALNALAHPYFDELRDPHTTYTPGRPLPELFNFDEHEISTNPSLKSILVPIHLQDSNSKGSAQDWTQKEPHPSSPIPSTLIPNIGCATEERLAQD